MSSQNLYFKTIEFTAHILPAFIGNMRAGITSILNSRMLTYNESLGGIVVGYRNVRPVSEHGVIANSTPHIHLRVRCDMLVYAPAAGTLLDGVVTRVGPVSASLVVDGVFNAVVRLTGRYKVTTGDDGTFAWSSGDVCPAEAARRERVAQNAAASGDDYEINDHITAGCTMRFTVDAVTTRGRSVIIQASVEQEGTGLVAYAKPVVEETYEENYGEGYGEGENYEGHEGQGEGENQGQGEGQYDEWNGDNGRYDEVYYDE